MLEALVVSGAYTGASIEDVFGIAILRAKLSANELAAVVG